MNILKKHYLIVLLAIPLFFSMVSVTYAGLGTFVEDVIFGLVVSVFGGLMGLGGMLLDIGIREFVVGFGDHFLTTGVGVAVDTLWVTVRDLFNLTFIFGLVYIGFKMILGSDDSGTKKWLVNLILAAILVNFSLYITKFIVDVSNITATQIASGFYSNISQDYEVSGTFMNLIGTQSMVGDIPSGLRGEGGAAYGYIFGSSFLFLIAAFVFGAGGFLLLVRYVVLILYMIFSPLMFLGWVFPGLQKVTDDFWRGFLGRAFFAPVYILLIYFAATVLGHLFVNIKNPEYAKIFAGSGVDVTANFSNTIPPFIIACIFLIASIVIANKMGANGASGAIKLGHSLRGYAQRKTGDYTAGLMAATGRKFIGGGGNRIAESKTVQRLARSGGLTGKLGRAVADSAHKARTSSFDVRNVGGLGKELGIGEGKKGGYEALRKEGVKKEKERAARYSTQEDTQLYDDMGKEVKEIKDGYDKVLENLDQTMADLSNETDPLKRKVLLDQARKLQGDKDFYEKNPNGDPYIANFNWIRNNEKAFKQNSYAANLERRKTDASIIGSLFHDQQINTEGADAIRIEMSKDNTKRLLDALQGLNVNP